MPRARGYNTLAIVAFILYPVMTTLFIVSQLVFPGSRNLAVLLPVIALILAVLCLMTWRRGDRWNLLAPIVMVTSIGWLYLILEAHAISPHTNLRGLTCAATEP